MFRSFSLQLLFQVEVQCCLCWWGARGTTWMWPQIHTWEGWCGGQSQSGVGTLHVAQAYMFHDCCSRAECRLYRWTHWRLFLVRLVVVWWCRGGPYRWNVEIIEIRCWGQTACSGTERHGKASFLLSSGHHQVVQEFAGRCLLSRFLRRLPSRAAGRWRIAGEAVDMYQWWWGYWGACSRLWGTMSRPSLVRNEEGSTKVSSWPR